MKIFKRNQLIVLVISLMLIAAGYLNFTSKNDDVLPTSKVTAELGDAKLVSSIPIPSSDSEKDVNELGNKDEENKKEEIAEAVSEEKNTVNNQDENIEETAKVKEDAYFTNSKLERESMYSQMLETYQEIYNNSGATAEQRAEAINEMSKINSTKNAIMIAENLISAKGFEKVVVFSNTNSISVVVGKEELKPEEIAQIQNIVSRELDVTADLIHISTK